MTIKFADRREAGQELGLALRGYAGRIDVLVLGLPRGGVPVAYEVAIALDAPLDVFIVRKIGMPGHEEFAIGALASGGVRVLDDDIIRSYGISGDAVAQLTTMEQRELERRERLYRDDRPPVDVLGQTVILIDDGLATGWTMRAAVAALRQKGPGAIVVAVPVAAPETASSFRDMVNDFYTLATPSPFYAVGLWYQNFSQTTDTEVRELLERASARLARR